MKKVLIVISALVLLLVFMVSVSYSAFTDSADILGSSFSVGSSDIKLLKDVTAGLDSSNLVDEMGGPSFTNISPNWMESYLVKIFNNTETDVALSTYSNYETANDPAELRQIVFVELFEWADANSDGLLDAGEKGISLGRKTIVKWKTEGYELGTLSAGSVKSLVLEFSTGAISETKQGTTALFDFEFVALGL